MTIEEKELIFYPSSSQGFFPRFIFSLHTGRHRATALLILGNKECVTFVVEINDARTCAIVHTSSRKSSTNKQNGITKITLLFFAAAAAGPFCRAWRQIDRNNNSNY